MMRYGLIATLLLVTSQAAAQDHGLYRCTAMSGVDAAADGTLTVLPEDSQLYGFWTEFIIDIRTGSLRNFGEDDAALERTYYIWQEGGGGNDFVFTPFRYEQYGSTFPHDAIRVRTWNGAPVTFEAQELGRLFTGTCEAA